MPYFYKDETGEIVYREHEFNSEAIDGLIHLVSNDVDSVLLLHSPNRKFGWDVSIVKEDTVESGYNLLQQLGSADKGEGKPYYKLIKKDFLEDYLSDNENLQLQNKAAKPVSTKSNTKVSYVEKDDGVPDVGNRSPKVKPEEKKKENYEVKLMRDEEKPIKIILR